MSAPRGRESTDAIPDVHVTEIMVQHYDGRFKVVADPMGAEPSIEIHTDLGGALRAVARALTGTPAGAPPEREIEDVATTGRKLPCGCAIGGQPCDAHRARDSAP